MSSSPSPQEQLPNWICHPDPEVYPGAKDHLTYADPNATYVAAGCPEHTASDGMSIPQQPLKALLTQAEQEAERRGRESRDIEVLDYLDRRGQASSLADEQQLYADAYQKAAEAMSELKPPHPNQEKDG